MILRQCLQRHGRRAVSGARPLFVRRAQSTTTTDSNVSSHFQSSLDDAHSRIQNLEALVNSQVEEPVRPFDANSELSNQNLNAEVARQHEAFVRRKREFSKLGADVASHYKPHTLLSNPPRPSEVTLELLLASEAHLGHSTSIWNPANARYIFGVRQGIHIISLDVIAAHLRRAAKVVEETARRGGLILFVGTRDGQDRCVVRAAELAGGCHLFERWIPGSITNGQQILGHCQMKIVDEHDQEVHGLEDQLAERSVLKPDLVVCLNPLENEVLLHECAMEPIPTIGIIDTNADPTKVTYPIPANDDSIRCVQVIAGVLGRAAEAGRIKRLEAAKRGEHLFNPASNLRISSSDAGNTDAEWLPEDEEELQRLQMGVSLGDGEALQGLESTSREAATVSQHSISP